MSPTDGERETERGVVGMERLKEKRKEAGNGIWHRTGGAEEE